MKKTITFLLIATISILSIFSEEAIFLSDDINIKYENSVWDELTDDSVNVITTPSVYQEQGYVALYNTDIFEDFEFIYLSEEGRSILTEMIDKYLNWETLAISKGVSISKDIPDLQIPVFAHYTSLGEAYTVKGLTLSASFHSVSLKEHYLILETDEKHPTDNKYADYKMDSWYFSHDSALALKNSITKENITNKIIEFNEQEALETEFI